ncbi:arginine N-methyltransferase 2 [Choiromyces venosus 120613-1]|uniref:Arginine N-methyltransferase 2 n=1 Tax=Choiromyces venosus 120613-1 TaxID=1336337 RepID=A0A3N4K3L6_9PEZI|nr:arginine N-methyltransferase 2 [Choiromyces venosus 120613-1]
MATTISVPAPTDPNTTMLLLASADHNTSVLTSLLKTSSPNVQDPDNKRTPLHVAIAACSKDDPPEKLRAAEDTLKLLLQNGAIWNDLDGEGETPGCVAYRLGLKGLYEVMVEAGVRAELILARLGGWEEIEDGDEDENDEDGEVEAAEGMEGVEKGGNGIETAVEAVAEEKKDVNSEDYLKSELKYHGDKLLDSDNNGVMMEWERNIMERSVEALLPGDKPGRSIMNVGFGMGIFDTLAQKKNVARHIIVEPHRDVLKKMKEEGWGEKPGVEILEGRWQDVLDSLVQTGETIDAIYFDTFAEDYSQLKLFFSEYVVALLSQEGGRFGFFHGLGADRRISHDVYTRVVEMDLFDAGLETTWETFELGEGEGQKEQVWEGVRRRYWTLGEYKLPVCVFME